MAKDFLKVRPRKEEAPPSATRAYQQQTPPARGRCGTAGGIENAGDTSRPALTPAGMFALKKHEAARKLQAIFKARLANRLRAEAALFGTIKKCIENIPNHWGKDGS